MPNLREVFLCAIYSISKCENFKNEKTRNERNVSKNANETFKDSRLKIKLP